MSRKDQTINQYVYLPEKLKRILKALENCCNNHGGCCTLCKLKPLCVSEWDIMIDSNQIRKYEPRKGVYEK